MNLFRSGEFSLAGGSVSGFKIDCDALTRTDYETLAEVAARLLPPFGAVDGVPRGGLAFAEALRPYATDGPLLVADDVLTTGGSMNRHRGGRDAVGVVVFARGPCPDWVTPLFTLNHGVDAVPVCGASRSSRWPAVRRDFLASNPACAACGRRDWLEVHHVVPFHVDPDLELSPHNLITLCDKPGSSHHHFLGHLGDWTRSNPHVREDAALYLSRVRAYR